MLKRLRGEDGIWAVMLGYVAIITSVLLSIAQQNQLGAVAAIACIIVFFVWWPKFPRED